MPTTEPIQIPIEGEASDFIADAKKVQAEMDAMSAKLKAAGVSQSAYNKAVANSKTAQKEAAVATQQTTTAVKQSSISITDLRSAYMIAADAARIAGQVWNATGQEFVNYAEQVKNMSRSLGASAEETSRIIQVADDVRISYDGLKMAMKQAQKEGIEPNIDNLAKLSDAYLALPPGVERTQFAIDKFGSKAGPEMEKLLVKGSDAIRDFSAAIDENMIITEQGIKASDEYQHSLDEMNDSFTAVKITIGSYLVGPATDLLNHYRDIGTSLKENGYWYTLTHQFALDDIKVKREEADAAFQASEANSDFSGSLEESAGALDDNKEAIEAAKDALKDYQDALEATSQANIDNANLSSQLAEDRKAYEKDHAAAIEAQAEAQRNLNEALRSSGEDGSAEAIDEARTAYDDATKSVQALEAASMEARDSMVYDMIQTKLAVDGLTDSELKALDAYAVSKGIKSQADVDETNRRIEEANAVVEGIKASEDVMVEDKKIAEETKRLETAISAEEALAANAAQAESVGVVTASIDSATLSYQRMAEAALATAAAAATIPPVSGTSSSGSENVMHSRDSGGSGVAGTPYMIGTGAQPEIFIPKTNGTFIPNADKAMGKTVNINITNPKGEASENSIRRALKQVSYLGYAI